MATSTRKEDKQDERAQDAADEQASNEQAEKQQDDADAAATANGQPDGEASDDDQPDAESDDSAEQAQDEKPQGEASGEDDSDEEPQDANDESPAGKPIDVPGEASLEVEFNTYPANSYAHDDLGFEEDDLIEIYRNMLLQRRFEERCRQMYQRQKISGFLHLYIGQEAVSTGSIQAIGLGEDTVITAYRDHGMALAMGMEPDACMAELFGKETGVSKGKGGSMHFFDAERRMFGGHGIVGAGVPLGAGIAFAHKYRGDDEICLCFFGDGAVNQGAFHEAANLAGLYDLPVVLICENNQYGMGTHIDRAMAESKVYRHAVSYDMPGSVANGMDVFSVNKAVRDHVEMAREGQPSLLELKTYRYQGHSISDPAKYRAEGELEGQQEQDAIARLHKYMLDEDLASEDALDEIDDEVKQETKDAIEFAEESDLPDEEAIYDDVYSEDDYPFLMR
jgi:pyruvate dehydrogenase E1 component alpha subunit